MGISWNVVACLLACSTVALADPAPSPVPVRRKPASEVYTPEALSTFVDALLADKEGDLSAAIDLYGRSLKHSPQANTYYNLANAQHRAEWYDRAIESYRKYLELSPDAPDRAEVERWIAAIEKRPTVVVIDGREPGAIVVVDGKLVGPSPAVIHPTQGRHVVDRIGPTSFVHKDFFTHARPRTTHVSMSHVEQVGNVVLSPSPRFFAPGRLTISGRELPFPSRVELPPGRYVATFPANRLACNSLVFEVSKGDHITHVYIDVLDDNDDGGCQPLTASTQKLRLPK
jgi:hypothetical protein